MIKEGGYVLVTPARNEQATIEITIKSVISQSALPKEWIIVSDRSTDQTDEITKRYAASYSFIRLLRIDGEPMHSFAALVRATESGLKSLHTKDYAYVGLLDGDVRFPPDYYEKLMAEFKADPKLGVAGGIVLDVGDTITYSHQNLNEVAGATQFFSRGCFESLGGLWAIPEGGWDAITCVRARMNGYRTATFPSLIMDHLKPRNVSQGNWWRRNWQHGVRDYVLGGHPAFEVVKCCRRVLDPPPFAGTIARIFGYLHSALSRRKILIPNEIRNHIRREQLQRLSAGFYRREPGGARE
jgi:poly-beta-1,6-N-acetyl-D-glucosamine synthase